MYAFSWYVLNIKLPLYVYGIYFAATHFFQRLYKIPTRIFPTAGAGAGYPHSARYRNNRKFP